MARKTQSALGKLVEERSSLGENRTVDDVLDMPITITRFQTIDTGMGEAVVIHIDTDEPPTTILTWSKVLIAQLELVKRDLPLEAIITKERAYYTFV